MQIPFCSTKYMRPHLQKFWHMSEAHSKSPFPLSFTLDKWMLKFDDFVLIEEKLRWMDDI